MKEFHNIKVWLIILYQRILGNLFLILLATAVLITCILYYTKDLLPRDKEFESIIGIIVLYIGLVINLINYKISFDQFFKNLFTEFNNKFDSMNDALNAIRDGKNEYSKNGIAKSKEAVILDYLNLCSEEYLWFSKGRIEYKVWKSWRKGMDFYLLNETFKSTVAKCKEERESYYGLFDEFDKK